MDYIQFKTPFMELYEELSVLNEAPMSRPQIYIKDLVGYKDGRPILKSDNDPEHQRSLFDLNLVDIEGSKNLNKGKTAVRTWDGGSKQKIISLELPDDENTWMLDSTSFSRNVKLRLKCSNPACRYGGTFDIPIKALNERIWGIDKNWGKYSNEQSIEDIALCGGCIKERTLSKKRADQGESDLWGKYKMSEIGGFGAEGNVVKVANSTDSLFVYLNKPASLMLNSDLENIKPEYWPAFDEKRTFYYNCPSCGLPHALKGPSLRLRKDVAHSAAHLVRCTICQKREEGKSQSTSIAEIEKIWERIPEWFFEDKSLGEEAILTKAGYNFLIEHNKENRSNVSLLSSLKLAFESEDDPKIKAAKHITKESELIIPLICTNLDCLTRNNGTAHSYISTPHLVNKGIYYGCDSCAGGGHNYSRAELFLSKSIELLFNVQHQKTKRIKPFHDIDILFTYAGKTFGIEYDGKRYHQDPKTILADEKKVRVFTEQQGIIFIRVREDGCAEFNTSESPAEVIKIGGWLLGLSQSAYESCLIEIGKVVTGDSSYEIPKTILPALRELFSRESKGKRDTQAIA
jgi:hypothetical protein